MHRKRPSLKQCPALTGGFLWLRIICDHAAGAISNARAFGKIADLKRQLELENEYLRKEVLEATASGEIVGQSSALRASLEQIELVAPTDASVLMLGESGTGKELVAREIHRRSKRSAKPLVRVNCAAIPRELYESEFFGHAKGAFTGAVQDRVGRFELAEGGTLFLDEVGEIPLDLQSKLLRVLQEGTYERVGEARTRQADVRIIAATNRDLAQEARAGRFRQDLYYRLNVFPIQVAPLRDRIEDLPLLALHFAAMAAQRFGRPEPRLNQATVQKLQGYAWPGNARELQSVIERALITTPPGGALRVELPQGADEIALGQPRASSAVAEDEVLSDEQMRALEASNLERALELCSGRVYGPDGAAQLLGLRPTTLASRLDKLGIRRGRQGPR